LKEKKKEEVREALETKEDPCWEEPPSYHLQASKEE